MGELAATGLRWARFELPCASCPVSPAVCKTESESVRGVVPHPGLGVGVCACAVRVQTRRPRKREESWLCREGSQRGLPMTGAAPAGLLNMPGLRKAQEKQKTKI